MAGQWILVRSKRGLQALAAVGTITVFGLLVASPFRLTFGSHTVPNEVLTQASDGFPVWISLWGKGTTDGPRRAAVLFVHGHTTSGPREPAYAILCKELADQGLIVAAPWLRGYSSDRALNLGNDFTASRWNPLPDISGAFAFLQKDPAVDLENIVVVGHSLGGGYALLFGLSDPRIAGIVSFSRLDMESRLRQWPDYFENARQSFSETFGLHAPMSADAFQEFADSQIFAFELAREALGKPNHPRVLFTVGGRERSSDRQWLAAYSAQAAGPADYYEFPDLTHSLNFWKLNWKLWIYNRHTMEKVASTLAQWIRRQPIGEVRE